MYSDCDVTERFKHDLFFSTKGIWEHIICTKAIIIRFKQLVDVN